MKDIEFEEIEFKNKSQPAISATTLNQLQANIKKALKSLQIGNIEDQHPVGSLYLTTVATDPATVFGIGTWKLWGAGKVPVCVDVNDPDFNKVEKIGGEKVHTLTAEENAKHDHLLNLKSVEVASGSGTWVAQYTENGQNIYSLKSSGGQAHNNLPPYITCYIWKRIS